MWMIQNSPPRTPSKNKIVTRASSRWQVKRVSPPPSYRCCLKSRNSLTEILFLFLPRCLSLPLATTVPTQCPKLDSSTTILRGGCTYLGRGGVTQLWGLGIRQNYTCPRWFNTRENNNIYVLCVRACVCVMYDDV